MAVGWIIAGAAAMAQSPDVSVFADLRPTISFSSSEDTRLRWYDTSGRHSLVGFRIILENGGRMYVAQRLQKMPGDADPDSLDEWFIELPPEWRAGKQYLPFGQKNIVREAVPAIRFNTTLVFDAVPIEIAYCDAGDERPRGIVGRVGNPNLGVSVATGQHFGIQGTSFTQFRDPGMAAGKGRGYQLMYGIDGSLKFGIATISGEYVALREGETNKDADADLTDFRARFSLPMTGWFAEAAWSRSWQDKQDIYRLSAEIPAADKVSIQPFVRFDHRGFHDGGVVARLRF